MKEICFRAWDKKEKKMHNIIQILWGSEPNPYPLSVDFFDSIKSHLFEDVELMQYTGLHDKNGKKIYEGDILNDNELVASNLFHNNLGLVDLPLQEQWIEITTDLEKREVIGNKFENPELLVKTKTMKYRVGDRVKATGDLPEGQVGTVVFVDDYSYVVKFDNWHEGHNCLNFGNETDCGNSGYWLGKRDLELIETETMPEIEEIETKTMPEFEEIEKAFRAFVSEGEKLIKKMKKTDY
jgi:hypothetical protein